jgi:glutamyl-tRNA synthetase
LDAAQLGRRLAPFFAAAGLPATEEELGRLAPMIQERITTLADAVDLTSWLWRDVSPAPDDLVPAKLDPAATGRFLGEVAKRLESLADWSAEALESACRDLAEAKGLKPRDAFQPIRVAVTGSKVSPPLFESMAALGRDRTLLRLAGAAGLLERAPA